MTLIDSELRALPKYFRNLKFSENYPKEGVSRDIYKTTDIVDRFKYWSSQSVLKEMENSGVNFGLISGLAFKDLGLQKLSNDYIEKTVQDNHNKLKGFYIINDENPLSMIKKIEMLNREVFVGVEFIPKWSGLDLTEQRYKVVFECLCELKVPVKIYTAHPTQHFQGNSVHQTFSLVRTYKDNFFVIPHLGGLLPLYAVNEGWENLFGNCIFLSSVSSSLKMIRFCSAVLPQNIAFATDYPFNHDLSIKNSVDKVFELDLDENSRSLLTYGNIFNFFGRNGKCLPI